MSALKQLAKEQARRRLPKVWQAWLDYKRPKTAEIELKYLDRVIAPGAITVDVGANRGLYTRPLAKLSSVVHAFEPTTGMATLLRSSMSRNVIVHQMALSDRSGTAEIHIPVSSGGKVFGIASLEAQSGQFVSETVRLGRLDEQIQHPAQFVKVDVEGHELKVLEGATGLIDRCRPAFLVEAEDRHRDGATSSTFRFFRERDYDGWFLLNGKMHAVEEFNISEMQDPEALLGNGGRKPNRYYINNFWFFPREDSKELVRKLER